jgi:hypothetical protein
VKTRVLLIVSFLLFIFGIQNVHASEFDKSDVNSNDSDNFNFQNQAGNW